MAQAYEYKVVGDTNFTTFASSLATEDAAGWEVIGYTGTWNGSSGSNPITYTALLRRRV